METLKQEQSDSLLNINLGSSDVELPKVVNAQPKYREMLDNSDISKALSGDTVSTLLIPEDVEIECPNYVIDYSKVKNTTVFQRNAIKSLISKDGDVTLYLYMEGKLLKIGYGRSDKLGNIIEIFRDHVAEENVRVYKDYQVGGKINEIIKKDITKIRLNL